MATVMTHKILAITVAAMSTTAVATIAPAVGLRRQHHNKDQQRS
jgi:hypothetical protein